MDSKLINVTVSDLRYDKEIDDYIREEKDIEYIYSAETKLCTLIADLIGENAICNDHIIGDTVQYIIKNNKVEWHVSTSDCTVDDYINTYPNEKLKLVVVWGIGADIPTLIQQFFTVLNWLMAIEWLRKKISKLRVKLFCRSLIGKDGHYIEFSDLTTLILSREEWKLNELMNLCRFWDETLTISILYYCGYECGEDNVFRFNPLLAKHNKEQFDDYQNR